MLMLGPHVSSELLDPPRHYTMIKLALLPLGEELLQFSLQQELGWSENREVAAAGWLGFVSCCFLWWLPS